MAHVNGCVKRLGSFTKASLYGFLTLLTFAASQAGPLTFQGSSGSKVASATFAQNGNQLIVTVANTSTADVLKPVDILTALFFSLAGNPSMAPVSAMVPNGSVVLFGPANGGNVGGEWAYRGFTKKGPFGANQGISSTSAGGFGKKNLFPGSNLQGPVSPDGLQYGITSAGYNPNGKGSKSVKGQNGLIKNEVVFTFDLPDGYSLDSYAKPISSISFEYGTGLSKKGYVPAFLIPEPSTWVLVGGSVLLLLQFRRRKA